MSASLSPRAKQTFQTVSLLATIMVVGIHYRSVTCDSDLLSHATANQLSQEFLLGGIARVAVPMFAFAAGLFYFQSFDGTWACYWKKLQQRIRSVAFPYFIIASVAIIFWLSVRKWEGEAVHLSVPQLLSMWWLRPPVEQLWFLRDLMVLVLIAPFVSLMANRVRHVGLVVVALLWFGEIQPFPQVAGWYLLNNETLFFFALGCAATKRTDLLEQICQLPVSVKFGLFVAWMGMALGRTLMQPNFDLWYVSQYSWTSLWLQKLSITVGCVAFFAMASQIHSVWVSQWSGAAFFVYLVHEFPLRAIMIKLADRVLPTPIQFWFTFPAVVILCFAVAMLLNRWAPAVLALFTGGRTPDSAMRIVRTAPAP